MRIFIYEAITAGALGNDVPPSLLREGQAMLSAITEDFQRISGIEVSHHSPLATHHGDWTLVIAPESDGLLQSLCQRVLDAGGRLLGCSPEAIRLTGDKLATADHWRKRNVPHPPTTLLDECNRDDLPYPCVIKPRHGAGSQATYLVADPRATRHSPLGDAIVQPHVEGIAASVALLVSPTQVVPLLPARQHLSVDGRFRYLGGSLPLPEPLASRATRLALQAIAGIDGLAGYVGVDLVLADAGDVAIEINPRLTTSYIGLRQLCRQNLAELMLRAVQGEPIALPTWKAGPVEFRVSER